MSIIDPKGARPGALAKSAKAARDGGRPDKQGLHAGKPTAAIPTGPKLERYGAAKDLREGAKHRGQGVKQAIGRRPGRAAKN